MLKKQLGTLKEEVNCKTKILLSTELELRRQLEQLDYADDWLERERAELEQTEFLQSWKLHGEMVSRMCQQVSQETNVLDGLSANLKVEGSVCIVNDDGKPLMCEAGGKEFSSAGNGTTELRKQLFADANAGATTVTGNTKKNLVSGGAAEMLNSAAKNNMPNVGAFPAAPMTSGIGGVQVRTRARLTSKRVVRGTLSDRLGMRCERLGTYYSIRKGAARIWPAHNALFCSPLCSHMCVGSSNTRFARSLLQYQPPNFLSNVENRGLSSDNDAWTQSLEKSMGVGMGNLNVGEMPPPPSAVSAPTLYTPPVANTPAVNLPPNPINLNNYQPARVMQQVAGHFQQFSLTALAERKMKQLNVEPSEQMVFRGSSIVGPNEAKKLYYSIPFISTLPTTNLVYSTRMHERSIRTLQQAVANVMAPTMVIIRSGEYVFGGYATDQWRFDGGRGGNPKGFLYSVTLDMKIPYHGRQKDSQSGAMGGGAGRKHDCMWSGLDFMGFGIKDLCLRGDFRMCTSEIEHSYSVGLDMGSTEAKCFLAGSSVWVADEIEVWSVTS